ncbi:hypothetical protein IT418_02360 [bacterium]|nr:hypothetical protein [bacterium]
MISYSPSIITFTPSQTTIDILIHDDGTVGENQSLSVVAIKKGSGTLSERICSTITFADFGSIKITGSNQRTISLRTNSEISAKLRNCLVTKGEMIALRVKFHQGTQSKNVSVMQDLLIPLFDYSQGSLLHKERTQEVLGELSQNLSVSSIICNPSIFWTRRDITCQTTVTNATDEGVVANIMATIREGMPPGLTTYGKLERTNLLLLPGESYSLSFILPKQSYRPFYNYIGIAASFTTTNNETVPFSVTNEIKIWYTPIALLVVLLGSLLLSAILMRKRFNKFTAQTNANKKSNI